MSIQWCGYLPRPLKECISPVPCPDPCATEAQRLGKQTQPLDCLPDVSPLADLLAYWKMEEGEFTTREDSHTGNYDLSPGGSPPALSGVIGNATRLHGTSGTYLENNSAAFGITGAMTMAGWMNFSNFTLSAGGQYLVGKMNMGLLAPPDFPTAGYMLYFNASGQLSFWQGNGVTTAEVSWTASSLSTGTWYYIAVGYTGSQAFIQVNAGTRQTGAGLTPTAGSEPFKFGEFKGAGGATPLLGPDVRVDEWGVWLNRALTTDDVTYLYRGGIGRTYPFS